MKVTITPYSVPTCAVTAHRVTSYNVKDITREEAAVCGEQVLACWDEMHQ